MIAILLACNDIRRGISTLQALLSGPSSARPALPEILSGADTPAASAARGERDGAESAGCWWKTHLARTCRSLVALKDGAEDGTVPDEISRAIVRLNFLMRHAYNAESWKQFQNFWRTITKDSNKYVLWKARKKTARVVHSPVVSPCHRSQPNIMEMAYPSMLESHYDLSVQ